MTETFEGWMAARDRWLQAAAVDLLEKGRPDENAVRTLADKCVTEQLNGDVPLKQFPKGIFESAQTGKSLRVLGVNGLKGINALDQAATLDFKGADITIVYGMNGCGKSGFSRLFRLATGSRKARPLLQNIYSNAPIEQQATFDISEDGQPSSLTWTATAGSLSKLKHVHVFDSHVARGYLVDKEEVCYEPRRLRFLGALSDVSDQVRDELLRREALLISKVPLVPAALQSSKYARLPSSLKPSETEDGVKKKITRNPNHDLRRALLADTVSTTDPTARLATLAGSIKRVDTLNEKLNQFEVSLSVAGVRNIVDCRKKALEARNAANELARVTLAGSSLSGIGGNTWKVMWEAARTFSASVPSVDLQFPPLEGDPCPLCQTSLETVAASRMGAFEDFVRGQVETDAKTAEALYAAIIDDLPALPSPEDWQALFPVAEEWGKQLYLILEATFQGISKGTIEEVEVATGSAHFGTIREVISIHRTGLTEEQGLLSSSMDVEQLPKLIAELADLSMLDWCHDNLPAILAELARVKQVDVLKKAGRRASTAEITRKKNLLAKEDLVGGYQERFMNELKFLGVHHVSVKPMEAGGAKGKVRFVLNIAGAENIAPLEDVLSEGEARVIALANFLADTSVSPVTSPFIFDDPVSSLDIEFEERVAQRLVELAKHRQVIVFTHRLSLACLLRDAHKRHKDSQSHLAEAQSISLNEIQLCRVGTRIGVTGGLNTLGGSIPQGLDHLLTRLKLAKEKEDSLDVVGYESDVKSICSDMRMLSERVVEDILLSGIVTRFKRGISTKDKLASLIKIDAPDCAFIEDLMTRYSVYEHSQSMELPSTPPTLLKLRQDIEGVKSWITGFKSKKVAA